MKKGVLLLSTLLAAASVQAQSSVSFRFGGDWISTPREKALYAVHPFIGDFGLPLEGIEGDGIADRADSAHPDLESFLQFPYGSLSDPPTFHLDKFYSAGTVVLDETFPDIPALFELAAIDAPDGDFLEFRSTLPSGRSRSKFVFWMKIGNYVLYQRKVPTSDSSVAIPGLEAIGMGQLRWIVRDGSQWWVSEETVHPHDPVLRFDSGDGHGRWARIPSPTSDLGSPDLHFEPVNFTGLFEIGFGNFGASFAEANESILRFREFKGTLTRVPYVSYAPQADLRLRLPRLEHDNRYDGNTATKVRNYSLKLRRTRKFGVSLQNDSRFGHHLHLRSQTFGRRIRVRLVDEGGRNRTAELRPGLKTSLLQSGESAEFSGTAKRVQKRKRKATTIYRLNASVAGEGSEVPYYYMQQPWQFSASGDELTLRLEGIRR